MGMTASQARFLCLTARKSNIEFEGQQINQQRTTLSNQSASYYSELCNMVVPTPPSVDDYTKVSYTFDDGAMTNTITSMIARRTDSGQNVYSINYIQQWQDDYAITAASSSMIAQEGSNYKIGSTTLRKLGDFNAERDYVMYKEDGKTSAEKYFTHIDSQGDEAIWLKGLTFKDLSTKFSSNAICGFYKIDSDGKLDKSVYYTISGNNYKQQPSGTEVTEIDSDYYFCTGNNKDETNLSKTLKAYKQLSDDRYYEMGDNFAANPEEAKIKNLGITSDNKGSDKSSLLEKDAYLNSLNESQRAELKEQEAYYKKLLNTDYNGGNDGEWFVRYVQNTSTGAYVPYFYKAGTKGLTNGDGVYDSIYNDGFAQINCYSIGTANKTKEVLNKTGTVERDSSGRYISITIYPNDKMDEKGVTYSLTTTTRTDDDAYNDAMNQYNYDQAKYDKKIQEINSKLEIIQQQDKTLELNLKHLDTEENAVKTEMDAVQAVLKDNVQKSFKTFQA